MPTFKVFIVVQVRHIGPAEGKLGLWWRRLCHCDIHLQLPTLFPSGHLRFVVIVNAAIH